MRGALMAFPMRLACATDGASIAAEIRAATAAEVRKEKLTGSSFRSKKIAVGIGGFPHVALVACAATGSTWGREAGFQDFAYGQTVVRVPSLVCSVERLAR